MPDIRGNNLKLIKMINNGINSKQLAQVFSVLFVLDNQHFVLLLLRLNDR